MFEICLAAGGGGCGGGEGVGSGGGDCLKVVLAGTVRQVIGDRC